jgi:glycosyltransferase involved in cell wall biosynthesis
VIPCFNCAHTVAAAIRSAREQTALPLEIIAVDDASNDGTKDALEALRRTHGDDWMQVIRLKRNCGAAVARNAGWNVARGEFVAFLDADDTWLPGKLERQFAFMRSNPRFAITGHLAHYGGPSPALRGSITSDGGYREISRFAVLLGNPMVTPSLMIRRESALRFHADSRHMEDHRLLQEAVFSGVRVARLEEVLAVIHKAAFGVSGLSAELWAMERAELCNYRSLHSAGHISVITLGLFSLYSMAKFARRLVIVGIRRLTG